MLFSRKNVCSNTMRGRQETLWVEMVAAFAKIVSPAMVLQKLCMWSGCLTLRPLRNLCVLCVFYFQRIRRILFVD